MTSPTFAFIISSAGGRVGKTTVARLLADYCILCNRPFKGFDTKFFDPRFAERFPRRVGVVDLNSISGQMALFDPLLIPGEGPKIVDLWHRATEPFFALCEKTRFFDEARRMGIAPILIFLAEPSQDSARLADRLAAHHPDLAMVTVHNDNEDRQGAATGLFAGLSPRPALRIAPLDPLLRETIDARGFSFSRFMLAPPIGMSIVLRSHLSAWILKAIAQFKSLEASMDLEAAGYPG